MRYCKLAISCSAALAGCGIGRDHYFGPDTPGDDAATADAAIADAATADAAISDGPPVDGALIDRPPITGPVAFQAYVKPSNTDAGDHFGGSVALSLDGSTLAIGAIHENSAGSDPNNNSADNAGAVYVFTRSGSVWVPEAYIKANHPDIDDLFGASVALSANGDTLAVGAMSEDGNARTIDGDETNNSAPAAGAAYVFRRTASAWRQDAYIKASNTDEHDAFGSSVALSADGSILAVGATGESSNGSGTDDNSLASSGAVFVFAHDGSAWTQQRYIKASSPVGMIQFGAAVALSATGSHLAVGVARNASFGEVYVFARSGAAWAQQLRYRSSDPNTAFGGSVALSADGSVLVVGSQRNSIDAAGGAVFTFTRTGATWSARSAALAPSNAGPGDNFGNSVTLSDDGTALAVSASLEDGNGTRLDGDPADNTRSDAGAVYLFLRAGAVWNQDAYIKASNTDAGDHFGDSVALSGDGSTLAVGATAEDSSATGVSTGSGGSDSNAADAGAVYVYR
jgi:trimeric autotransporter adhesin